MVVHSGLKAHLTGGLANAIEARTHGAETRLDILARFHARGRKYDEMLRAEGLQKPHGLASLFDHGLVLRRIVDRSAKRNCRHMQVALRDLLLELRRSQIVGL